MSYRNPEKQQQLLQTAAPLLPLQTPFPAKRLIKRNSSWPWPLKFFGFCLAFLYIFSSCTVVSCRCYLVKGLHLGSFGFTIKICIYFMSKCGVCTCVIQWQYCIPWLWLLGIYNILVCIIVLSLKTKLIVEFLSSAISFPLYGYVLWAQSSCSFWFSFLFRTFI